MKKLIFICGANGVGKSTVSKALNNRLTNSVYIDSEYCCSINPFEFNNQTIRLIKQNLSALMINSFQCDFIETVIFPYGFHGPRKQIFDDVIQELRLVRVLYINLTVFMTFRKATHPAPLNRIAAGRESASLLV